MKANPTPKYMTNRDIAATVVAAWRKARPLYRGVMLYFPDALMEVANVSRVANEQHNPGEPIHWAKAKSSDELDALMRHLPNAGGFDTDGLRESAKVAWRALANLQRELDAARDVGTYPKYVV